jgi:hypothetical protein
MSGLRRALFCRYLVAARGHDELPFAVDDIAEVFQTRHDQSPEQKGGWKYWDHSS